MLLRVASKIVQNDGAVLAEETYPAASVSSVSLTPDCSQEPEERNRDKLVLSAPLERTDCRS
jgi:hypothetical protein